VIRTASGNPERFGASVVVNLTFFFTLASPRCRTNPVHRNIPASIRAVRIQFPAWRRRTMIGGDVWIAPAPKAVMGAPARLVHEIADFAIIPFAGAVGI